MDSRTQQSLEKLIARVERHKPTDMSAVNDLANEIKSIFQLLKSRVQSADRSFRLMQSKITKELHDNPQEEDELYKKMAESDEQSNLLHYQELEIAFKDWLRKRLERAKQSIRTNQLTKKYEKDDF